MAFLDRGARPFLPQNIINSQTHRAICDFLQPRGQVEIEELRLRLLSPQFFQSALDGSTVFGLGQDGDIVKARNLHRPLPSNFRFRTFERLTGKGGEENSLPARHFWNYVFPLPGMASFDSLPSQERPVAVITLGWSPSSGLVFPSRRSSVAPRERRPGAPATPLCKWNNQKAAGGCECALRAGHDIGPSNKVAAVLSSAVSSATSRCARGPHSP